MLSMHLIPISYLVRPIIIIWYAQDGKR